MNISNRARWQILTTVMFITVILFPGGSAFAQSTAQPPAAPTEGKSFSENLRALVERASQLIPRLQEEVESPLLSWFEKICIALAAIIVLFSFARMWKESSGAQ